MDRCQNSEVDDDHHDPGDEHRSGAVNSTKEKDLMEWFEKEEGETEEEEEDQQQEKKDITSPCSRGSLWSCGSWKHLMTSHNTTQASHVAFMITCGPVILCFSITHKISSQTQQIGILVVLRT